MRTVSGDNRERMSSEVPSLATAPRLTRANAEHVALESFGITGRAIELPSERDQNFRITTDDSRRFVLKIANAAERRIMLEAENACMHHLAATGLAPEPVPTRDGQEIAQHGDHLVRLITWIDGRTLGGARWHSEALLTDLGRAIGLVDRTLESFDHPALHRAFHWDLAHAPALVERHVDRIPDPALGARHRRHARGASRPGRTAPAVIAAQRDPRRRQRLQRSD